MNCPLLSIKHNLHNEQTHPFSGSIILLPRGLYIYLIMKLCCDVDLFHRVLHDYQVLHSNIFSKLDSHLDSVSIFMLCRNGFS